MGVDVKACVMTKNKDVFNVSELIKDALIQKMHKEAGVEGFRLWHSNLGYSSPQIELHTNGMLWVTFQYKGEDRKMAVFFTCDGDYKNEMGGELRGKKIILSLGCWGSAEEIIETCLDALHILGSTYIIRNDCSLDWEFYK